MLPIAKELQAALHERTALPNLDGRRILAVDDTKEALNMFVPSCAPPGRRSSPQRRWTRHCWCAREEIDAVVTDLAMPGGDGIELINSLRNEPGRKPFKVAAMIALGSSMREASMSAGADAFLEKPIEPADLVRVLAGL